MSDAILKPLSCAGCGAPLTVAQDQRLVTCGFCGQSHAFVPPPPPEPRGSRYREGDEIATLWGGCWWPARVVREEGEEAWLVHYDGWGSHWDETIGPERIRHRTTTDRAQARRTRIRPVAALVVTVLVLAAGIGAYLSYTTASGQAGTGSAVGASGPGDPVARYAVGDQVDIHWSNRWWPGRIEKVEGQDRYLISFDGWAATWNEVVGPRRLRKRHH